VCICLVGSLIWVLSHLGTIHGVVQGDRAAATIAFQYGKGITPKEFSHTGDQDTSCSEAGITCLGEDSTPSTAIPIPEEDESNWTRIAVIVNYQVGGDSSRILISTKSRDISLNYANHRDGSTYQQIAFQMGDVKALSESQRSYWFPVDVMYRETGISFPITVTVEEDRRHSHSATAMFEIPRKEATSARTSKPPKRSDAQKQSDGLDTQLNSRQITVAKRVATIIARRLNMSSEKATPDADFEIDLGASPTEVRLIIYDFEEEYGLSIPKAQALKIRTVGEAINYIEAKAAHK
jgi:acyl carrier protein